jgi:hypothetical protein
MRKYQMLPASFVLLLSGVLALTLSTISAQAQNMGVPEYKVDPFWPKVPFPNAWLIQGVPFITTDDNDHIWAVSRADDMRPDEAMATYSPPRGDCCVPAPEIIEFDAEGNIHNAWGGPDYHPQWATRPQSVVVDSDFNVWVSAFGQGEGLMKFTREGKFLWDFPHRGPRPAPGDAPIPRSFEDNQATDVLVNGVHNFALDNEAREIYITEGKRVLVYDMDNGDFKRGWGGHGMPLSEISNEHTPAYDWNGGPPPYQEAFAPALHCTMISNDGLVYICERGMNRIQVFTKQGEHVQDIMVAPNTPARGPMCGGPGHATLPMCGTTFSLAFSHDEEQQYMYVADGTNHRVWIHERLSGEHVGQFGSPGRNAGQLYWIDGIASDSQGNLYTGEVLTGKRVQKFELTNP